MKHLRLVFVVVGSFPLLFGCADYSGRRSQDVQRDQLELVDSKLLNLESAIANLNGVAQTIGKRVEELAQKTNNMDVNYSRLYSELDGLGSKVAAAEATDSSVGAVISDTQANLSELSKRLSEIEKAKSDLQNQILALQAQKPRTSGGSAIEQRSETMKEEAREIVGKGREMAREAKPEKKQEDDKKIAELVAMQTKEALQKSLDGALQLYRKGNYKEAVSKWEEALILDPENLEAKFNIEIAKEKIKSLSDR
ncbi:MAG: hypothetical protein AAB067_00730 [Planctomycetota bacterium]